jgi:hypothetical protein
MEMFETVDGHALLWTDPVGVTHACTAADVYPELRVTWTLCDREVPPNGAQPAAPERGADCAVCLAHTGDGSPDGAAPETRTQG